MSQPFDGLTVIDLSGLVGAYATRLLASLGADVIKIEPPNGSPLRRMTPFIDDAPQHERSLWWAYLAMGTRSVVIDITDDDQRNQLADLLQTADIVVDDHGPDILDVLGIGYEATKTTNPGVVWIAITPFGQTGPKRGWSSSNLVAWAASGVLYTVGFDDQPPVVPGGPAQMGMFTTSLHAATGAVLGLRGRRLTGAGQLVDLSLADSVLALSPEVGIPVFLDDQVHRARAGNRRTISRPFGIYPCSDGYVSILVLMPRHWEAMAGWVNEVCGNDAITDPVFSDMAVRGQTMELIDGWVEELTESMTLLEFFQEGQRRGIPITPVNTISSLRADPHLEFSDFWETTELPGGGTATIPGPPFRTDRNWWRNDRAPRLGEHTDETLLGLTA